MTNPFDWEYLTRVPKGEEAYGPFALAYVGVFVLGLGISILLDRVLRRRLRHHALHQRLAERATQITGWVFAAGLIFFGLRALEVPLLGMRLWLYLSVLAVLVTAALGLWYWRMRYPEQLRRYEQEQARRQYLKPAREAPKVRRSTPSRRRR